MKHSKFRFSAVIALLLVFCMLLSSCSIFGKNDSDDHDDDQSENGGTDGDGTENGGGTGDGDEGGDEGNTPTVPCTHAQTVLVGKVDPTCSVKGYTGDTVCSACTTVVVKGSEINTIDHSYDSGKVTKNPTCIETGIKTFTCSGCGITKTESVNTVAHNDVYHNAGDGTHFHTCRTCTLNENNEHTPVDAGVSYPASCTEPAYLELTCANCQGKYKIYDETQPALSHEFGEWDVTRNATCRAVGLKTQSCTRPGCTEAHNIELPKTETCNMVFVGYGPAPTCVDGGTAHYECADCGAEETKPVAATGVHSYEPQEDKGDGWTHKVCSSCSDTISSYDASNDKSATLSAGTIDKSQALEMDMEKATIQFPTDVVGQITGDESKDVSISADEADTTKTEEAIEKIDDPAVKEAISNATVYDFTVTVGDSVFTDKFDTKVAITMPYNEYVEDASGIVIYYLAEDGTIETITEVVYDAQSCTVTFFVEHFSFYAVAFVETQEMRCRRGDHNFQATTDSVTASCHSFGYTVYECIGCHRKTVDNIVERLPHNYGELIEAKPTCSSGDYSHKICQNEGCGDILLIQFKGATGHVIDAPATCTTPATCTKCENVVYRALGHSWTEWEIVVKPTEVTNGLRRRNCETCGTIEEITLAATGNIDTITYNSYSELVNLIFDKLLGIKSGSISFELTDAEGNKYIASVNAQKNEGGYTLLMSIPGAIYYSDASVAENAIIYYRNGVFVADIPGDAVYSSEIDSLNNIPMDVFKAVLEDIHAELNYYVENYVKMARVLFAEYSPIVEAEIDAILAAAGSEFTVAKLENLIDAIETVYAYMSLKLGYATNAEIIEGITLPEVADLEAIVEALTILTEDDDGNKIYTYDLTELINATNTVVEWLEEKSVETVAEFIYGLIGEKLLETNETIVDFDAFIDWIAAEVPGTLTVADGVDKLLMILEDNDIITLDSIYNLIDELAYKITGTNFNSRAYVAENGKATLNDFAGMMLGSSEVTLDMLYDQIKLYAGGLTVGDLGYQGVTVSYATGYAKQMLEGIKLVGGLTFVFDKDGNFVSFELTEDFQMATDYNEETEEYIYSSYEKATLTVVRDDSIVVELPEDLGAAILDVKTSYDEEGNLIVEGLDDSYDLSFNISGSGQVNVEDIIKVDEKMSEELGYTVYVADEKYWRAGKSYEMFYLIDGKYYTAKYAYYSKATSTDTVANLSAIVSDPESVLPEPESAPDGYVENWDGELIPAWYIGIGVIYQEYGEWMFARCDGYYTDNSENTTIYKSSSPVTFSEFAANVRISSTNAMNYISFYNGGLEYVTVDGDKYRIIRAYLYVDGSGETAYCNAIIKGNELFAIDYDEYRFIEGYNELTEISALPDRTGYKVEQGRTTMYIKNAEGERELVEATVYGYCVPAPLYFVEVADGIYSELGRYWFSGEDYENRLPDYISGDVYVDAYETMQLPDGNILYVKGTDYKPDDNGYTVIYGFAKNAEGLYTQALCRMDGESIVSVEYREAYSTYYVSYSETYNIYDYLTNLGNGKYKISATLLAELAKYCTEPDRGYYIQVVVDRVVDGREFSNGYTLVCNYVKPEVSLGDILGGFGGSLAENYWERYFGHGGSYNEYSFNLNDDGSLTIYFENGCVINNIEYSFGNRLPVDTDKLVKDESNNYNGLDIYKLELSQDASSTHVYIYKNGKYYAYDTPANYSLELVNDPFARYYVRSMTYRYDTVIGEGLEGGIPVYRTEIAFRDYIEIGGGDYYITVYTLVIDGKIYVAKQAQELGNSVLQFESYVELDEYMKSLEFVVNNDWPAYDNSVYINGVLTFVKREVYDVYETDDEGNRIDSAIETVWFYYVTESGTKYYVYGDTQIGNVLLLGDEIQVDESDYVEITYHNTDYVNGEFTMAECRYTYKENATLLYVKLAGKYYRFNECYCHNFWFGKGCYWCASIDEDQFINSSFDKVWYYEVCDKYENLIGYYERFGISDEGFVPENQIYELPNGMKESKTFLGYTTDGNMIWEISLYVESASGKEYTVETQPDGTVFYHVDGIGYLKDQSGRYIPAYKMLNTKGEYEIVCRIHSAYVQDEYSYYPSVLDAYVDVNIGNGYITITPELLEVARANRNYFFIRLYVEGLGEIELNYDILEALFEGRMPEGNPDNYPEYDPDKYPEGGEDFGGENFGGIGDVEGGEPPVEQEPEKKPMG